MREIIEGNIFQVFSDALPEYIIGPMTREELVSLALECNSAKQTNKEIDNGAGILFESGPIALQIFVDRCVISIKDWEFVTPSRALMYEFMDDIYEYFSYVNTRWGVKSGYGIELKNKEVKLGKNEYHSELKDLQINYWIGNQIERMQFASMGALELTVGYCHSQFVQYNFFQIYLMGSRVNGEGDNGRRVRDNSDHDIFVVIGDSAPEDFSTSNTRARIFLDGLRSAWDAEGYGPLDVFVMRRFEFNEMRHDKTTAAGKARLGIIVASLSRANQTRGEKQG